jgi:hypothetical protein
LLPPSMPRTAQHHAARHIRTRSQSARHDTVTATQPLASTASRNTYMAKSRRTVCTEGLSHLGESVPRPSSRARTLGASGRGEWQGRPQGCRRAATLAGSSSPLARVSPRVANTHALRRWRPALCVCGRLHHGLAALASLGRRRRLASPLAGCLLGRRRAARRGPRGRRSGRRGTLAVGHERHGRPRGG